MAWSKTEYPYELAPAHNLNWVTASNTTDYNENSFRYSFDIRMTDIGGTFTPGLTGTSLGTFYVPPRPITGEGKISPSGIWKDNLATTLDPAGASGGGASGAGYQQTQVTYNYNYINTSGVGVTGSPITGTTKRTWSAVFDYEEWANYDWTAWEVGGTATAGATNFLTDGPTSRCALNNDLLYALVQDYTPPNSSFNTTNTTQNKTDFAGSGFYGGDWFEVTNPDSTGGTDLTWSWTAGVGIKAGSFPNVNSYSNILVPTPQSDPYIRLRAGGTYVFQFLTDFNYGDLTSGFHVYGKRDDNGVWERLAAFIEYSASGQQQFRASATIGSSYGYEVLGIAVDAGFSVTAEISELQFLVYTNPGGMAWAVNEGGTVTEYDVTVDQMNYLNTGTLALGTTSDYNVAIINTANGTALTKTISYDYDCNTCSNCERVSLVWLNSKGGYDVFDFQCTNTKNYQVTRQEANRFLGEGYSVGTRGFINNKNVMQLAKTVNTNYTTEADVVWLESLLRSPDVYELRDDNTLIPVIIDTTSYNTFVTQDKLKIVEFEYRLGYNIQSQNI